jgi:serine protease DegQ
MRHLQLGLKIKIKRNIKMKKLLLLLLLSGTACASKIERVIQKAEPKVVKIGIVLDNGKEAVCSGEFLTDDGLVLTCAHCFEHGGITKVFVKTSDHQVYRGIGAIANADKDLALVLADLKGRKVPYFKLGKRPTVGQEVVSLGSPLGIQGVAGVGYVSKILEGTYTYVIHSAFVNPGNSGGALVNLKGQLVGVNEAILMVNPMLEAQGMFVAIDVQTIIDFIMQGAK